MTGMLLLCTVELFVQEIKTTTKRLTTAAIFSFFEFMLIELFPPCTITNSTKEYNTMYSLMTIESVQLMKKISLLVCECLLCFLKFLKEEVLP